MTVENTPKPLENTTEKRPLYPERPSYSAEKLLNEILKYLSGEREKEVLTEDEKNSLIEFTNPFVNELAQAYSIEYNVKTLYPEYFDTPEGQNVLQESILSAYL